MVFSVLLQSPCIWRRREQAVETYIFIMDLRYAQIFILSVKSLSLVKIDDEYRYGVGAVDQFGVQAQGEAATGFSEWIMTKVRLDSDITELDTL